MWCLWNFHEHWLQPRAALLIPFRVLDAVLILLALVGAAIALPRGGAGRAAGALLAGYPLPPATPHREPRRATPRRRALLCPRARALGSRVRPRALPGGPRPR